MTNFTSRIMRYVLIIALGVLVPASGAFAQFLLFQSGFSEGSVASSSSSFILESASGIQFGGLGSSTNFIEAGGLYKIGQGITGIEEAPAEKNTLASIPSVYMLKHPYPNPTKARFAVTFGVPDPGGKVNLKLYEVNGRLIKILETGALSPGYHTLTFNAKEFPAGVYFLMMEAGGFKAVKKMVITR